MPTNVCAVFIQCILLTSSVLLECVCNMYATLIQSPHHQPGVIVSPNSFVHRCEAVSASKVQMSAALNQQPDALHLQARLHSHSERGL